jgi:hypothetical protein
MNQSFEFAMKDFLAQALNATHIYDDDVQTCTYSSTPRYALDRARLAGERIAELDRNLGEREPGGPGGCSGCGSLTSEPVAFADPSTARALQLQAGRSELQATRSAIPG